MDSAEEAKEGPQLQEFGRNCFLIRNALTIDEQLQLVEVVSTQKAAWEEFMGPTNEVAFDMEAGDMKPLDTSAPGKAVAKATDFITANCSLQNLKPANELGVYCVDARFYGETKTLSYHCDDIKKGNSVVFLFSIGRSANFYVHCPEMGGDQSNDGKLFEFRSGDLLFFDATKEAGVCHGIESIGPKSSCPSELMGVLSEVRVGLQIRAS